MHAFLVTVFTAVLVIALIPILLGILVWRAWWLYPAWGWFLVPLGVPPIPFWHFIGLTFFVSVLMHQTDTKKDEREEDRGKIVINLVWPVIAWALMFWIAAE